jgi:histone H3/H4
MVDLIVKNKIKDVVKLRVSIDLPGALNKKIEEILKKAEERAKANHRTTILPQDV